MTHGPWHTFSSCCLKHGHDWQIIGEYGYKDYKMVQCSRCRAIQYRL